MEGYFVSWKGQTKGPLEKADVEQMLINGDISPLHALTLNGELVDIDRWIHSLREASAPATYSEPTQNVIAPKLEPMFSLPTTKTTEESDLFSKQSGPDANTPPHYPPPLPPPPPYFSQGPSYESAVSPPPPPPLTSNTQKPQRIKNAVLMLWISLGLGVVRSAWEIPAQADKSTLGFVISVMVFTLLFMGFFIWMIDRGKNWARITFLVLFILGVPLSILPLLQSLAYAPISGLIGVAQVVLQTIAVVFIFLKDSSAWFKDQKNNFGR